MVRQCRPEAPRARIELNYDVAIRSLVAAGHGAAMLPLTPRAPTTRGRRARADPAAEPEADATPGHRAPPARRSLDGATEWVIETLDDSSRRLSGAAAQDHRSRSPSLIASGTSFWVSSASR